METLKPSKSFGRPLDVDPNKLNEIRDEGIKKDLAGLPSEDIYRRESRYTPKWNCDCGTTHIPCAQSECPICNSPRPEEWRDPEQGESIELGAHRIRAGARNDFNL